MRLRCRLALEESANNLLKMMLDSTRPCKWCQQYLFRDVERVAAQGQRARPFGTSLGAGLVGNLVVQVDDIMGERLSFLRKWRS